MRLIFSSIQKIRWPHNQELEAKDKEISWLNAILEKAFKWFPMLREMLRMEKLCTAIGFTKEMIESLLTKKRGYQVQWQDLFRRTQTEV